MEKYSRDVLKLVKKWRNFPHNTSPVSRHAEIIGEALVRGQTYPMLQEEAEHCGQSILYTVALLYEAKSKLSRRKDRKR